MKNVVFIFFLLLPVVAFSSDLRIYYAIGPHYSSGVYNGYIDLDFYEDGLIKSGTEVIYSSEGDYIIRQFKIEIKKNNLEIHFNINDGVTTDQIIVYRNIDSDTIEKDHRGKIFKISYRSNDIYDTFYNNKLIFSYQGSKILIARKKTEFCYSFENSIPKEGKCFDVQIDGTFFVYKIENNRFEIEQKEYGKDSNGNDYYEYIMKYYLEGGIPDVADFKTTILNNYIVGIFGDISRAVYPFFLPKILRQ